MQKNNNPARPPAISACPSPVLSHGTTSTSNSGWTSDGAWSFPASHQPSRSSTPALALNSSLTFTDSTTTTPSGDTRTHTDPTSWSKADGIRYFSSQIHAQQSNRLLPNPRGHDDASESCELPAPRSRGKSHIPRPPNAFMLFRAEKVNTELPPDLPNRQQVVSVVAGQCWNMLDDKGKAEWHNRARDMLKKHMERYPDYKFSPSRKSSRKKDEEVEVRDGEDYIRHLREKYMQMVGPTVASSRPRKTKPRKTRGSASDAQAPAYQPVSASPLSLHSSAGMTSYPVDHSALNFGPYGSQIYPSYPHGQLTMQASAPYMGTNPEIDFAALTASYALINSCSRTTTPSPAPSSSSQASSSGASTPSEDELAQVIDNDKTPTAATFGNIAIPRHPVVPNISNFANVNAGSHHLLGLHDLSPYAGIYHAQHHTQTQASLSSSPSCPPGHQDLSVAAYFSLFPSGMHQSPSAEVSSSSRTPSPSSTIPTEVQETFGVRGNPSPA